MLVCDWTLAPARFCIFPPFESVLITNPRIDAVGALRDKKCSAATATLVATCLLGSVESLAPPSAHVVDLRSDTVTQPTAAMREAMKVAEVGDDVFGDDPTVQKLERRVADLLGKEAGVFVPSGTMGNLVSMLSHCRERGSEYIVGDQAHIYIFEQGGAAQFGGCHPRALRTFEDGTIGSPKTWKP